jgi:predicted PilT family ATPase
MSKTKMVEECSFLMWSLGINDNNAVVMSWCQHPNEGTAIGYDAGAEGMRKLSEMFLAAAKQIEKAEKAKQAEIKKQEKKQEKKLAKKLAKKPKMTNENPKCTDYDDEGRCNGCGQFDCYECDWGDDDDE